MVNRRTVIKGCAATVALLAAPAIALPRYSVEQFVADLRAAGVKIMLAPDWIGYGVVGVDWQAFHEARLKAHAAGITDEDVYDALAPAAPQT